MNRLIALVALSLILNACGCKLVKKSEKTSAPIATNSLIAKTEVSKITPVTNQTEKFSNIKVKSNTAAEELTVTYNLIKKRGFLDRKSTANINSLVISQNIKGCNMVRLSTGPALPVKVVNLLR